MCVCVGGGEGEGVLALKKRKSCHLDGRPK